MDETTTKQPTADDGKSQQNLAARALAADNNDATNNDPRDNTEFWVEGLQQRDALQGIEDPPREQESQDSDRIEETPRLEPDAITGILVLIQEQRQDQEKQAKALVEALTSLRQEQTAMEQRIEQKAMEREAATSAVILDALSGLGQRQRELEKKLEQRATEREAAPEIIASNAQANPEQRQQRANIPVARDPPTGRVVGRNSVTNDSAVEALRAYQQADLPNMAAGANTTADSYDILGFFSGTSKNDEASNLLGDIFQPRQCVCEDTINMGDINNSSSSFSSLEDCGDVIFFVEKPLLGMLSKTAAISADIDETESCIIIKSEDVCFTSMLQFSGDFLSSDDLQCVMELFQSSQDLECVFKTFSSSHFPSEEKELADAVQSCLAEAPLGVFSSGKEFDVVSSSTVWDPGGNSLPCCGSAGKSNERVTQTGEKRHQRRLILVSLSGLTSLTANQRKLDSRLDHEGRIW